MKRIEVRKLQVAATEVITKRPGRTVGGTRAALRKIEARLALMNLDLSEGGFSLACALMRASDRRAHLLRHRRMYDQGRDISETLLSRPWGGDGHNRQNLQNQGFVDASP